MIAAGLPSPLMPSLISDSEEIPKTGEPLKPVKQEIKEELPDEITESEQQSQLYGKIHLQLHLSVLSRRTCLQTMGSSYLS